MALRTIKGVDELRSLVGQEVGHSDWLVVTQDMIDGFADATGDHQWIHVDRERSKRQSPFGATIAHGFLTLSLLVPLQSQTLRVEAGQKLGINYGLNRVRFPNPVRAGARIRSHSTLKAVDDVEGGVQLTWLMTVELENEPKPALVAEWIGRVYY